MTSDDATFRPQEVDYLGFLEAQLRDLQGIQTLAYELIQNADDVQNGDGERGATWIVFDVTADALLVTNDGSFRPADFDRMQILAGGGKREEAGTTGAFGLGFLAVYQVTDRPEIFSGGRHWIIRPEAPPAERIEERRVETANTCFRLPWALDAGSPVRRRLRLPAVHPEQLDSFASTISQAIEVAALFLRRLQRLEVRREGVLVRRITREVKEESLLRLADDRGQSARWLLLDGNFAASATALRARYPWQIEAARESELRVAIPLQAVSGQGRLYAGLPTESTSPLPFHVNADFFPTTDRKRIHLGDGYQAAWNEAALTGAAATVAGNLELVRIALGPAGFWQWLQQLAATRQLVEQGDLPDIFATFWETVWPLLAQQRTVYTLDGEWRLPADARLVERPPTGAVVRLLGELQLPLVHPDLALYTTLLGHPAIGVPLLTASDVAAALHAAGLTRPAPLALAPHFLRSLDQLQALWQLIDRLLDRSPADREQGLALLAPLALVLTEAMGLERRERVYRGSDEARALFPEVPWLHPLAPLDGFPGRYVAEFGVRQATTVLAEMDHDQLEEAWRLGRLDLPRLFRWFESRQIEILVDDPGLARTIRRLPLGPAGGELRPLADLYIPGGFTDPLGTAGLVDLPALGGRAEFLQDLGVEELTFDTFLHEQLPRVLQTQAALPSDARHQLLQLLAERLGQYRDDEELRHTLCGLPLVPSMDGSFRPAETSYTEREARLLLGDRAHIAEPAANKAVASLFQWLGVRPLPDASALIAALLVSSSAAQGEPLAASTLEQVRAIWRRLAALLEAAEITAATVLPLRHRAVIPDRRGVLRQPSELAFADDDGLAQRFPPVAGQLLAPGHKAAAAFTAAGVQPLTTQVQPRLTASPDAARHPALEQRLGERAPLIVRVVRAELGEAGALRATFLAGLQVWVSQSRQLTHELTLGEQKLVSAPEEVTVWLDREANRLYVPAGEPQALWLPIARELALALRPGRPAGSLAVAIRDVLVPAMAAQAASILDELGYPPAPTT